MNEVELAREISPDLAAYLEWLESLGFPEWVRELAADDYPMRERNEFRAGWKAGYAAGQRDTQNRRAPMPWRCPECAGTSSHRPGCPLESARLAAQAFQEELGDLRTRIRDLEAQLAAAGQRAEDAVRSATAERTAVWTVLHDFAIDRTEAGVACCRLCSATWDSARGEAERHAADCPAASRDGLRAS